MGSVVLWLVWLVYTAWRAPLHADEAYYWVWTQLGSWSWGYFDHPPLTAWLIAFSTEWLGRSELAVRLPFLVAHLGLCIVVLRWLGFRAWLWLLACPLMHVYGFLAVPDSLLLFLGVVFLWRWERWVDYPTWKDTLLLGGVAGLMGLAKYHAILIVLFAVLPEFLRVARRVQLWVMGAVGLLVVAPHLVWLGQHEWVTVVYQVGGRAGPPPVWSDPLVFLGVQLVVFGGLSGPWLWWVLVRQVVFLVVGRLEEGGMPMGAVRRHAWGAIGIPLFFGVASLWTRPEVHWAFPALPFWIGVVRDFSWLQGVFSRVVRGLVVLSVLVGVCIHPLFWLSSDGFPGWMQSVVRPVTLWFADGVSWIRKVNRRLADAPVLFIGGYQRPSLWWFYTGRVSAPLTTVYGRPDEFVRQGVLARFWGRRVYVVLNWVSVAVETLHVGGWDSVISYRVVDSFFYPQVPWLVLAEAGCRWSGQKGSLVCGLTGGWRRDRFWKQPELFVSGSKRFFLCLGVRSWVDGHGFQKSVYFPEYAVPVRDSFHVVVHIPAEVLRRVAKDEDVDWLPAICVSGLPPPYQYPFAGL